MTHETLGLLALFIATFGFVCVSIVLAALRQNAASERLARGTSVGLETGANAETVAYANERTRSTVPYDSLGVEPEAIGDERSHRLLIAREQRAYVDNQDNAIWREVNALRHLVHRGFWGRMKWIIRGI